MWGSGFRSALSPNAWCRDAGYTIILSKEAGPIQGGCQHGAFGDLRDFAFRHSSSTPLAIRTNPASSWNRTASPASTPASTPSATRASTRCSNPTPGRTPASLIYDYRLKIRVNIDHILGDENNLERIPNELKGEGKKDSLRRLFEGAVMEAERRAAANYMIAVPHYYNDRIQLLLPICLLGDAPDLALAIQRESGYYSARTCLTLEMAYSNARLVNRPESTWIRPEGVE